jgi:hypothetical protein
VFSRRTGRELDGIARKHEKVRDELTAAGELAGGAGLVLPDETLVLRLGADEPSLERARSAVAATTRNT